MWSSPSRDERAAFLLHDVASAHDAGLTTEAILSGPATATLGGAAAPDATLPDGLRAKGLELAPHEQLMLSTANLSGNLSAALRNIAKNREDRAARNRELRRRLAYPVFLLAFGFMVSLIASSITNRGVWVPILVVASIIGTVYLIAAYVRKKAHDPDAFRIPLASAIARDAGELPYLHAMHGLYGAGVKIAEAHDLALRTSPMEGLRMQLYQAGQNIQTGESYADALQHQATLHPETRQMLAAAEASGDVEAALQRAIIRRQQSLDSSTRRLVVVAIAVVTLLVYGYCAYVIISFYSDYYGRLLSR